MATPCVALTLCLCVGVAFAFEADGLTAEDKEFARWVRLPPRMPKAVPQGDGPQILLVTPTTVSGNEATLTFTWANMGFTGSYDYIGIWPVGTHLGTKSPIKFRRTCPKGAKYAPSNGTLTLTLLNRRTSYKAMYISGAPEYPEIYAISDVITFTQESAPLYGRLALTPAHRSGSPFDMDVIWNQKQTKNPGVLLRTSLTGQPVFHPSAVTYTYTRSDLCDADTQPAANEGWFDPGVFTFTTLTNLTPATQYFYSYGDQPFGFSEVKSFTTPPAPGADVVIHAFGDMGQAPDDGAQQHSFDFGDRGEMPALNTTAALAQIVKNGELVLHIGDISYAVGFLSEWDQFTQQVETVASRVPWQAGLGNHEYGHTGSFFGPMADSGGECGVPFYANFPAAVGDSTIPPYKTKTFWYSFNYGSVHVVVTSTEHDFRKGSPQHAWVVQDLKGVDRSVTPWLVFTGHRPMYCDGSYPPAVEEWKMLAEAFEDLFIEYGVDICLWGHEHMYSRTCAIYNSTCVAKGPVHYIIGNAGYDLSRKMNPVQHPFVQFRTNTHYGFLKMSFTGHTAQLDLIDAMTLAVVDTSTIHRQ